MKTKPDLAFAERLLMVLVSDATASEKHAARVRETIKTLAAEFGIRTPEPEEVL